MLLDWNDLFYSWHLAIRQLVLPSFSCILPEAFGLDSRLKSGTGVLLFRLFLLPCPSSATSVILCLKFKMATISLTPFSDGFRSNSIEDHKSRTNLDSARFDVYSPDDGTRPLSLHRPAAAADADGAVGRAPVAASVI